METVIYKFIKNKRGTVGVVLASKKANGKIGLGWSRCNVTAGDKFNKETGLKIAAGRAEKGAFDPPPQSLLEPLAFMKSRAVKCFKGCEVEPIDYSIV